MTTQRINLISDLFQPFAYESLTISTSAVQLTQATFTDSNNNLAKKALITIETAQIRWRIDGTDPTSSEGHLSNPFDVITLKGTQNLKNFRAIRVGSSNATIRVSYST